LIYTASFNFQLFQLKSHHSIKMGIDHTSINVEPDKFDEVIAFYLGALGPLGYVETIRPIETVVGLGADGKSDFWIASKKDAVSNKVHTAFSAKGKHLDSPQKCTNNRQSICPRFMDRP
jgi:4-hydroxyphenylpyruvate dioxygenase-like putative hemolysin